MIEDDDDLISGANLSNLTVVWLSMFAITIWIIAILRLVLILYLIPNANDVETFIRKIDSTAQIQIRLSPSGKPAGTRITLS